MSGKKKCLIFANCQGPHIGALLSSTKFNDFFEIIPTVGVQCKNPKNLDEETLRSLDLLIHQPISDVFGEFFSSKRVRACLKESCETIMFPSLFFNGYFPQYCRPSHTRLFHTVSFGPYGLFPHGDANIINLLGEGKTIE
ncbi:hypothetical protein LJC59_07795, partial [Desulfovibrio sp. OttesenSCG-928-A18]|nr:hypothetical protein [Desulfovibrio sp. OttesenSCG-928-A18]